MKSKTFYGLALTLIVVCLAPCSAVARHQALMTNEPAEPRSAVKDDADPISGEWSVSFFVHGSTTPGTFTLKLEGTKVTGSAYSDHTEAGTIRDGKWVDGKLSFVLDFKNHESISIKGTAKEGKLAGEFTTEGFTSSWEAKRK